jgi:Na+:H+ antiporter, NhaA family
MTEVPPNGLPRAGHDDDGTMEPGAFDLRHSWSESNRFVPRAVVRPLQSFMELEAASGIMMLLAAVVALVWANSPFREAYLELWATSIALEIGTHVHLDLALRDWVNDGLMALFFLLAGLEIKRELALGELRDPRAAALPAIAALGGMVVPAAIYTAVNLGGEGSRGWGIPMATDIAFAVGVVALLGSRVPATAKLFLLTLAIVDDLGAIAVIAVFYTSSLAFGWLAVAVASVGAAYLLRRNDVRLVVPYVALGVLCWLALHESGVHPTLAGVAFGLLTPSWSFYDPKHFGPSARSLVGAIEQRFADGLTVDEHQANEVTLRDLGRLAN